MSTNHSSVELVVLVYLLASAQPLSDGYGIPRDSRKDFLTLPRTGRVEWFEGLLC